MPLRGGNGTDDDPSGYGADDGMAFTGRTARKGEKCGENDCAKHCGLPSTMEGSLPYRCKSVNTGSVRSERKCMGPLSRALEIS